MRRQPKGGAVMLFVCWFVLLSGKATAMHHGKEESECMKDLPSTRYDWKKPGVFDGLSENEIKGVLTYMTNVKSMDVKLFGQAKTNSTYVLSIERQIPPKAEVLNYLDGNKAKPPPARFARIVLVRGDVNTPVIEEYKVGPLPNPNVHQFVSYPKYRNGIPFRARQMSMNPAEMWSTYTLVGMEMYKLNPLLKEATGGYTVGFTCGDKCIDLLSSGPAYGQGSKRNMWFWLKKMAEGSYLHPIGVEAKVNIESVYASEWRLEAVSYRGHIYNSTDELLQAYQRGDFNVSADKPITSDHTLFSSLHRRGTPVPEVPRRGPETRMPDGRRFQVQGHHVTWLSWAFDYNMQTSSGPQIYDARFNGERIIYEISLQELLVYYSGNNPSLYYQVYFDSASFHAAFTNQLIPGVDCPDHAVYMDFTHYLYGATRLIKNCVCVFEHKELVPLRRHFSSDYAGGFYFAHGMSDNVLVARTVMTIGNYDYMYDVIFRQNGAVETRVSLTGYIISSRYNEPKDTAYGFQVADNIIGNLHGHFANIKVDLDVRGTSNRFASLNIERQQVDDPEGKGTKVHINKFVKDEKLTEREATYKYNFDLPKYLVFYNKNETNKWGHERSYRLLPVTMAKSLIPEGYTWENGASWIRYQVAVTKHSDEENTISNSYNQMMSDTPVVTLQDFIDDNENITDKDLVAWVTLGTHHIPHTEDIPITATTGVQLSLLILPYNYFKEDPSIASRDNVRMSPGGKFEYYGNKQTSNCVDGGKVSFGVELKSCFNPIAYLTLITIVIILCQF